MSVRYLLLLMLFHQAYSYYFYNPSTQLILSLPSLRGKPYGFKLIPAPRSRSDFVFRKDLIPNSRCTESGFRCTNPYDRAQTHQFECERDTQCPSSFKCCPQKCFQHKICVKAKLQAKKPKTSNPNTGDPHSNSLKANPGICETYNFKCSRPFTYTSTSMFECGNDKQCPRGFKCCPQSCFVHKICSRSIPTVGVPYVEEMKKNGEIEITAFSTSENVTPVRNEATEDVTEEGGESTTEINKEIIESREEDSTTETEEVTEFSTLENVIPIGVETTKDKIDEGVESTTEINEEIIETTVEDEGTEFPTSIEKEATREVTEEEVESTSTTEDSTIEMETTTATSILTTTVTTTDLEDETISDTIATERKMSTEEDITTVAEVYTEIETIPTGSPIPETNTIIAGERMHDEDIGELVSINLLELKTLKTTPDPNSIVPEYSEYYYDYANRNDTEKDDDDYY